MEEKEVGLKEIPDSEWAKLNRTVKKSGGRILLLVHPFFRWGMKKGGLERYESVTEGILRKSKFPVVILEGIESIRAGVTKKMMKKLGPKNALVIPTERGGHFLLMETVNGEPVFSSKIDFLAKHLAEKAGVKSIYIGGMFAEAGSSKPVREYESLWLAKKLGNKPSRFEYLKKPLTEGCAGIVYKKLIKSGRFETVRWIPNAKVGYSLKIGKGRPYVAPRRIRRK